MCHMNKIQEFVDGKCRIFKAKKKNPLLIALIVIGGIAVVAAIAYAVYRFLAPSYIDDFDDDFDDDDFDEDFFADYDDEDDAETEENIFHEEEK